jgi:aspartyl-tRNA(Asn)/glutamyl-tRNA(Gln) amidotransferase subunit A
MTAVLTDLTLAEARDGMAAGDFLALDLTRAHIAQVEAARDLNAFITETPELALAAAEASDARRASGDAAGPMDGIPIAVKDLFCTEGVLTTAGSHILDGFTPPYESTVTANLKQAGAVMLGKTNLDEFAMGSANVTSYYGPVKNPWKAADGKDLVPGGSSGGSAAAVAARTCLGATGTDTGGSIRQPGSFCGIVGMKPTYGRCSRWGIVAFASSLDQAGPLTRTVRDGAIMLGAMAGHDPRDSTSAPVDLPDFEAALTGDIRGLRVGVPKEYRLEGMPGEIETLWSQGAAWLRDAGAEMVDVTLPHTPYALPTYYIVAPAEASSNLARYDGVRYAPPGPHRHLRAQRRLLRRLLPEGAETAHPDRRRLQEGFRDRRRAAHADGAVGGLRHRREDGRPHRHVPERRLHGARQPHRPARHFRAGGAQRRRAALGAAPGGPALRRGNHVPGRRRAGDGGRIRHPAANGGGGIRSWPT